MKVKKKKLTKGEISRRWKLWRVLVRKKPYSFRAIGGIINVCYVEIASRIRSASTICVPSVIRKEVRIELGEDEEARDDRE